MAITRRAPAKRCGEHHTEGTEDDTYRATVLASERITDADWQLLPDGSTLRVGDDGGLRTAPINDTYPLRVEPKAP
jgi:hypothetical protein